jgi:hypothetical protein
MVDDDITQRPDSIVKVTTILDAERLGHVDLDTLDVAAVPQRLEGLVREAKVQDLIETHRYHGGEQERLDLRIEHR